MSAYHFVTLPNHVANSRRDVGGPRQLQPIAFLRVIFFCFFGAGLVFFTKFHQFDLRKGTDGDVTIHYQYCIYGFIFLKN
jgi:hypothetical protein